MNNDGSNILTPKKGEIKRFHNKDILYNKFAEGQLYFPCVEALRKVKLEKIKEKDIQGPIKTFLLNWGIMGRVLLNDDYEGWEYKLKNSLKEIGNKLEKIRDFKLEEEDITQPQIAKTIKDCYRELIDIRGFGATAVSKVLHVICPSFFPLWDVDIRIKIGKEAQKKIGDSALGYYKFMTLTKEFIDEYPEISELSNKYRKSKVKIVDEYFHNASR